MTAPATSRTRRAPAAPQPFTVPAERRGLLKDLLFTRNNASLDIARLSAAVSVVAFWAAVGWTVYRTGQFDPVQVGTGCAAIFAASAAWIHFRQKHEPGAGA